MTVRLIYTLAITLLVSACGGGGGGGTDTPAIPPSELEGTWKKPCGIGVGEDPGQLRAIYNVITLTYANDVLDTSIENYVDQTCDTAADENIDGILPVSTSSATVVIGNDITATNGPATEIDTTTNTSNGNPFTDVQYSIFDVNNTNILYIGNLEAPNDGSTAALRPDTLDFDRAYFLQ